MTKRIYNFNMIKNGWNCTCTYYRAWGWIKGQYVACEMGFNGYSKKHIEKALKNRLRESI